MYGFLVSFLINARRSTFFNSVRLDQDSMSFNNRRSVTDTLTSISLRFELSSLLSSLGCADSENVEGFACFSNRVGVNASGRLPRLPLLILALFDRQRLVRISVGECRA